MKDWQIRALKTFVEAFGGTCVPAVVIVLSDIGNKLPDNWNSALLTFVPIICSSIAAGIAAVWNIILEHLRGRDK